MSSRYYQPTRHNVIAKHLYENIRQKRDQKCKIEYKGNEFIDHYNGTEYWWNVPIKTAAKVRRNQPDLVIWEIKSKNCHIIESSWPADLNATKKVAEKFENYGPLIRILQLTHPNHKFLFVQISVGALGTVTKDVYENIRQLDFNKKEPNDIIKAIQKRDIIGRVKMSVTFINIKK